jgi:hypothetical protein
MRFKLFILTVFLIFLSNNAVEAQVNASLETSFNLGLASFQTDYGERHNFKSGVTGNVGFAVGGSLYINFFNTDPGIAGDPNWMQRHLKLRLETSYLSAGLEHFGKHLEGRENMKGRTSVINMGSILEYHPFVIPDFVPGLKRRVSPYLGLGFMGGYAMPIVETNQAKLIEAYRGHTDSRSFLTYSLIPSAGLRFELNGGQIIMLDMRWQYFDSDYVDGLSPDPMLTSNTHNDWLTYINVGYVYMFGKEGGRNSTWDD